MFFSAMFIDCHLGTLHSLNKYYFCYNNFIDLSFNNNVGLLLRS